MGDCQESSWDLHPDSEGIRVGQSENLGSYTARKEASAGPMGSFGILRPFRVIPN